MFKVEMLDAYEGDALWIEYGQDDDPHRMLIDAGRKSTYREIANRVAALQKPLELFVLTHVDDDHIFGAVPLFADKRVKANQFKDIWFNGYMHLDPGEVRRPKRDILGPKNGEIFGALLSAGKFAWNEKFGQSGPVVIEDDGPLPVIPLDGGMRITLLSPRWSDLIALKPFWEKKLKDMEAVDAETALKLFEERRDLQPDRLGGSIDMERILDTDRENLDTKEPNGSSIAFLAEFEGISVMFAGDAHPTVLDQSIQRLRKERYLGDQLTLDAFKLSHHGSKGNTSASLLSQIACKNYLISTNGRKHGHPDQETLARILKRNKERGARTTFYFNHLSNYTRPWDDEDLKDEWNYETVYPPKGRVMKLKA